MNKVFYSLFLLPLLVIVFISCSADTGDDAGIKEDTNPDEETVIIDKNGSEESIDVSYYTEYLESFISRMSDESASLQSYEILDVSPLYSVMDTEFDFFGFVYDIECSDGTRHYFVVDCDRCRVTEFAESESPYAPYTSQSSEVKFLYAPLSYYAAIYDESAGAYRVISCLTGEDVTQTFKEGPREPGEPQETVG